MANGAQKTTPRRRSRATPVASPASRPLRAHSRDELLQQFETAVLRRHGLRGAHSVHELWMRGEPGLNVERMLARLWASAVESIPEWLPMGYVEWLPVAYDVATRFTPAGRGRSNLYLVLLDYSDSRAEPYGIYVGMTHYTPAERFDQHKAGIRAAGSVLRRGVEVLTGPTLHLQRIPRTEAVRVEAELAEALRAAGLFVQGGH